ATTAAAVTSATFVSAYITQSVATFTSANSTATTATIAIASAAPVATATTITSATFAPGTTNQSTATFTTSATAAGQSSTPFNSPSTFSEASNPIAAEQPAASLHCLRHYQSITTVRHLCVPRRYTCWMDGSPYQPSMCYLASQEGNVLLQPCEQTLRFVCREK
ncbi:hypothetical protein Vretifemale_4939, partial [Volvox reticuliferus]